MKTGVDGQGPVKEPEEERSGVNPVRKTTLTNRFNLAEEYWESLFNRWSVSEAYVAGQQWRRNDANERINANRPSNTQNFLAQYCQFIQGVISETQMDVKVEPASGKINLPPRPPSPAPAAQAEPGAEQAGAAQAGTEPRREDHAALHAGTVGQAEHHQGTPRNHRRRLPRAYPPRAQQLKLRRPPPTRRRPPCARRRRLLSPR